MLRPLYFDPCKANNREFDIYNTRLLESLRKKGTRIFQRQAQHAWIERLGATHAVDDFLF